MDSFFNLTNRDEEKRHIHPEQHLIVLQYRDFVSQAVESYNRLRNQRKNPDIYEVKTRIMTLFDFVKDELRLSLSIEEYNELVKNLSSNEAPLIFDVYDNINAWLSSKGLLRLFKNEVIL